jgi:hypothetical protein
MKRKKTNHMALEVKKETDEVTVPGKGKFSYEYEVVSGNFEDASTHAQANGETLEALGKAYFTLLNTREKANERQKVYNANIDPAEKAKMDAIRLIAKAIGGGKSKEEARAAAQKMFADLATGVGEDSDGE